MPRPRPSQVTWGLELTERNPLGYLRPSRPKRRKAKKPAAGGGVAPGGQAGAGDEDFDQEEEQPSRLRPLAVLLEAAAQMTDDDEEEGTQPTQRVGVLELLGLHNGGSRPVPKLCAVCLIDANEDLLVCQHCGDAAVHAGCCSSAIADLNLQSSVRAIALCPTCIETIRGGLALEADEPEPAAANAFDVLAAKEPSLSTRVQRAGRGSVAAADVFEEVRCSLKRLHGEADLLLPADDAEYAVLQDELVAHGVVELLRGAVPDLPGAMAQLAAALQLAELGKAMRSQLCTVLDKAKRGYTLDSSRSGLLRPYRLAELAQRVRAFVVGPLADSLGLDHTDEVTAAGNHTDEARADEGDDDGAEEMEAGEGPVGVLL